MNCHYDLFWLSFLFKFLVSNLFFFFKEIEVLILILCNHFNQHLGVLECTKYIKTKLGIEPVLNESTVSWEIRDITTDTR